jgi:thiol-disulfide isomerase/thioredoxin
MDSIQNYKIKSNQNYNEKSNQNYNEKSNQNYKEKYMKYKMKYLQLKNISNNNIQLGGGNELSLNLFKADWCGHCQNFKPVWEELKKNKIIDNKPIEYIEYNDKDKAKWEKTNTGINGYPTIILKVGQKVGTKVIEYNGPRTVDDIIKFIKSYVK